MAKAIAEATDWDSVAHEAVDLVQRINAYMDRSSRMAKNLILMGHPNEAIEILDAMIHAASGMEGNEREQERERDAVEPGVAP